MRFIYKRFSGLHDKGSCNINNNNNKNQRTEGEIHTLIDILIVLSIDRYILT